LVAMANGVVTGAARAAFDRAAVLAPGAAKPRFYLALAKAQDGNVAGASADWRALLAGAPQDAPWRAAIEERVAWASAKLARGPSAEDIAAVENLDPQSRRELVAGMVLRLAERLKGDERDLDGWLKLVGAYGMLGEREKALAALVEARALFASDSAALTRIDAASRDLGLSQP
jgi:cytochrome c-type biogenesis protein CcmH